MFWGRRFQDKSEKVRKERQSKPGTTLFQAQRVGGAQASRMQFLLYVSVHSSSEPLLRRVAAASRRVSDMTA